MKRWLAALVAVIVLMAIPTAAQAKPSDCTSRTFRHLAEKVYLPWNKPIHGKWKLKRLKHCAPNATTRHQMRRIEKKLVHGRTRAIRRYRKLTACDFPGYSRSDCQAPDGTRFSIPFFVVNGESGGGDGVSYSWTIRSPFSGGGCCGLLQSTWDANAPAWLRGATPPSWPHMLQLKIALKVEHTNGPKAWQCWDPGC